MKRSRKGLGKSSESRNILKKLVKMASNQLYGGLLIYSLRKGSLPKTEKDAELQWSMQAAIKCIVKMRRVLFAHTSVTWQ